MMEGMCKNCTACEFMPSQRWERTLLLRNAFQDTPSLVLIIDDAFSVGRESVAMDRSKQLLDREISFDYCTSVRCYFKIGDISTDEFNDALSRCSVWTNQVISGRSLIITGMSGLSQLKIEKAHEEGDLFRHARLGVVLVTPPIISAEMDINFNSYHAKVQRALKVLKL